MNKSKIENAEMLLQERYDIMVSFNNKADETYYKGMVSMLEAIGYEVIVKDDNVSILPM